MFSYMRAHFGRAWFSIRPQSLFLLFIMATQAKTAHRAQTDVQTKPIDSPNRQFNSLPSPLLTPPTNPPKKLLTKKQNQELNFSSFCFLF